MRLFDAGAPEGPQHVSTRILTVPNVISVLRIAALPLIYRALVGDAPVTALVLFAAFAATDWLDGYLARKLDQVSKLGQLLDPIADRAFFLVAGVGVIVAEILPWWAIGLVIVRDIAILVAGLALLRSGAGAPAVTHLGKAATFGLMVSITVLLAAGAAGGGFGEPVEWIRTTGLVLFGISVVAYWLAAVDYARQVMPRRNE